MRVTLTLSIAIIIVIFLSSSPTMGSGQDRDLAMSISGPRPLADAASQLQSKLGIAISYEDVALVYAGDYARALDTDWGRKYAEQNDQFKVAKRFGLVGGSLDIPVAIDPISGTPVLPVTQILQDVIEQHKARGNPGQFRLLTIDNGFAIHNGANTRRIARAGR